MQHSAAERRNRSRPALLTLHTLAAVLLAPVGYSLAAGCGVDREPLDPSTRLPTTDAEPPDGCAGALRCSSDLHSILDGCTGETVRTCAEEEGCADGTCVPACASADAQLGTIGCSFWTVPPAASSNGPPPFDYFDWQGSCFAALVANTWNRPVNLRVDYKGAQLDITRSIVVPRTDQEGTTYEPLQGPLPAGQVAIIFLSQEPTNGNIESEFIACPAPAVAASSGTPLPRGTGKASAFHLSSDLPVSAYSIYPYGGAPSHVPSATALFPTSSYRKNYLVVNTWDSTVRDDFPRAQRTLQIVAPFENTQVRIDANLQDPPGLDGGPGRTRVYTLGQGEVLQFVQAADLSGAPIQSDKPIAVFGGANCIFIPTGVPYGDTTQQQLPPIAAWGNEYAAVRYRNRGELWNGKPVKDESVPWRIVGAVDGTALSYDPVKPTGAPVKLDKGQAWTFESDTPFVIRSQDGEHPFYMAAYMTGADAVRENSLGDAEFVNVVPADQYLNSYIFFADVTYDFTNLVVVRRNDGSGFKDVALDCAGVIGDWRPVDAAGRYQYAYVDLVRFSTPRAYDGGVCSNGRHEIRSDGAFGVTVWGLAEHSSYAYPGGAGLRTLSSVEVPVR